MKKPKPKPTVARPFRVSYAGAFDGHCTKLHNALECAERHLQRDSYSRATITDKRTGKDEAWLTWDGRRLSVEMAKKLGRMEV